CLVLVGMLLRAFLCVVGRRRPRAAVFPYTTLFRSMACDVEGGSILAPLPGFVMYGMSAQLQGLKFIGVPLTADFELDEAAMLAADRKSTRLNSSHVKISYAVFCLRKKNRADLTPAV